MSITRLSIVALSIAFGIYCGICIEARNIQQTCEADDAVTTINGTKYLCFSQRQIEQMRRRHEREA